VVVVFVVWLVLCFLGLLVGVVAGFLGVGGGFLYVPVLHFVGGLGVVEGVGSSLVVVFVTALSSAVGHFWRGRVDVVLGLVLEGVSIPGAFLGALLTGVVSGRVVSWVFAGGIIVVGVVMASRVGLRGGLRLGPVLRRRVMSGGGWWEYEVSLPLSLGGSFLAGVASGFLGIGGGVVKVPLLVVLGVPVHVAVGTSCFMMSLTALAGVLGHLVLGHVDFASALAMGVGAVVGGQVGAALSGRVGVVWLRRFFGVFLCCVGVYMLVVG